VVNALSTRLDVWVRRGGQEYHMAFAHGEKRSDLEVVGEVGARRTGTTVRFWPEAAYFETVKFSLPRLHHVLRAKAVLCPGLQVRWRDENTGVGLQVIGGQHDDLGVLRAMAVFEDLLAVDRLAPVGPG
jgi:topoisomerase-4 subunit B